MMKMTKFLKLLESSDKFRKTVSEKYMEVSILVLFLWKTCKGAHSNHIRLKNWRKTQKMMNITKFPKYLEYQGIFWETFSLKYIKAYVISSMFLGYQTPKLTYTLFSQQNINFHK